MTPYQLYREDGSIDIAPEVMSVPAIRRLVDHHDEGDTKRSWLRILIRVYAPRSVIPRDWSLEARVKYAMAEERQSNYHLRGSWTRVNHELWQPAVDALLELYQDDELDSLAGYEEKMRELNALIRKTPIQEQKTVIHPGKPKGRRKKGDAVGDEEDEAGAAVSETVLVDNTKLHEGWANLLKKIQLQHAELKHRIWPKLRGGERTATMADAPRPT